MIAATGFKTRSFPLHGDSLHILSVWTSPLSDQEEEEENVVVVGSLWYIATLEPVVVELIWSGHVAPRRQGTEAALLTLLWFVMQWPC